ncbi:hypothetical protein [Rhizorhabdus sp. FW153]|uniref:hypothetical protein n=1 Tax=Rhizorhabdus sp. FW153 TaxID=3400216 RepID=UPI003CED3C90
MLMLAQIDLSNADLALFDEYESAVLALLEKYGARLEDRLRSTDGRTEVHLLYFPDAGSLAGFRSDPIRASAQSIWERSRASSSLTEVTRLK